MLKIISPGKFILVCLVELEFISYEHGAKRGVLTRGPTAIPMPYGILGGSPVVSFIGGVA